MPQGGMRNSMPKPFDDGESLIAATRTNLCQRKFSLLSLTVTEANARAVELYARLGFEKKRVFDAFVWES